LLAVVAVGSHGLAFHAMSALPPRSDGDLRDFDADNVPRWAEAITVNLPPLIV
jgi:hypothetical protein